MKNQDRTPLLDVLLARAKRGVTSFHTPGHKNGQGIDARLRGYTGRNVYKLDVTVFPEVDSLHDPVGPIKKAQALMAEESVGVSGFNAFSFIRRKSEIAHSHHPNSSSKEYSLRSSDHRRNNRRCSCSA